MTAQIVWAESTDIEDVLGGEVYATVYASRTHPRLAEAVESVNEALEWEASPQAYLLLPVTLDEDGEPVVHGAECDLLRMDGVVTHRPHRVGRDFERGLLTLARQARGEK